MLCIKMHNIVCGILFYIVVIIAVSNPALAGECSLTTATAVNLCDYELNDEFDEINTKWHLLQNRFGLKVMVYDVAAPADSGVMFIISGGRVARMQAYKSISMSEVDINSFYQRYERTCSFAGYKAIVKEMAHGLEMYCGDCPPPSCLDLPLDENKREECVSEKQFCSVASVKSTGGNVVYMNPSSAATLTTGKN